MPSPRCWSRASSWPGWRGCPPDRSAARTPRGGPWGRSASGSLRRWRWVPSGATSCTGRWTGGSCSSSTAATGLFDDPQGAIAILPALQLGLCAAFWVAVGARGPWRRLVLGVVGLAGLQLTVLLGLGELSHHLGFAPHVSLIRAWGVVVPLAVVWVLRRPRLTVSPPAPVPVHPLPQPG